jgi:alpha-D-ribose 1-methylphosphonate 5-triphosphate synthase subunit PhnL
MSYRPTGPSRKQYCPRYAVGRVVSDRNLERQIDIECCVRIGESGSEKSAILTLAYGEYAMKK